MILSNMLISNSVKYCIESADILPAMSSQVNLSGSNSWTGVVVFCRAKKARIKIKKKQKVLINRG